MWCSYKQKNHFQHDIFSCGTVKSILQVPLYTDHSQTIPDLQLLIIIASRVLALWKTILLCSWLPVLLLSPDRVFNWLRCTGWLYHTNCHLVYMLIKAGTISFILIKTSVSQYCYHTYMYVHIPEHFKHVFCFVFFQALYKARMDFLGKKV